MDETSQADSASSILVTRSTASAQPVGMVSSLRRWRHDARLAFRARCVPDASRVAVALPWPSLPMASAMSLSRSQVRVLVDECGAGGAVAHAFHQFPQLQMDSNLADTNRQVGRTLQVKGPLILRESSRGRY
jgi:hypothetical protein